MHHYLPRAAALMAALCCAITSAAGSPNSIFTRDASPRATGFLDKTVDAQGQQSRYALYVPDNYSTKQAWPLIVFLHGAGERGDDNLRQTEVGIGRAIRLHREWFPALVLMPQCPEDRFWDAAIPAIEAAIAQTRSEYRVDDRAITLTGLSLGGYATWIWGAQRADLFAALMPICGGGDLEQLSKRFPARTLAAFGAMDSRVRNLATLPIWAFHGSDDDVVPQERSAEMVARVKAAGGDVQYTVFQGAGHNSWDQAYGDRRHIRWLLKQRKK